VFGIDFERYKLVDMSLRVVPGQTVPGRPFETREGRLGDGTRKTDVVDTHTHVGTHIESPYHFYVNANPSRSTCTDYPLEKFMGPATLLKGTLAEGEERIGLEAVKAQLEPRRGAFKILYVRNDTDRRPLRFDMAVVPYFADLGLNLFIFDSTIEFGQGQQDGETFHDLLMRKDVLLVEFPDNGQALDRDEFYMFAVPLNIQGLDSSWCRLFAVVER
jgi:kynurenine formamidase